MPLQVTDSTSNANEQIAHAAEAIGRSGNKRRVFDTVYTGKQLVRTVQFIADETDLTRKQVLDAAKPLVNRQVLDQSKQDGDTAYRKINFIHANKKRILALAGNPKKLAEYPTKRNSIVRLPKTITLRTRGAQAVQVTIDDIDSFGKAHGIKADQSLPQHVSERSFKKGIQSILGDQGNFTDWGGERNDLLSTRLRIDGKRHTVAFAFKGPGTKGKLTPGKMGKNGDQIQRLFQSTAYVFIVQYWRDVDESVLEQMRSLAIAKSLTGGRKMWYGIIDGVDSNRIYQAYHSRFK